MSEITIKKLLKTDYPFVRAVWEAAGLSIRPVCKGRDSEEAFSAQLEFEGSFYIGAFEGERLVGVLLANHEGRKGWLNRMAVHPDYRRRGIAAQMVKAAEELLKKREYTSTAPSSKIGTRFPLM